MDWIAEMLYIGSAKVAFESTHEEDGLNIIALVLVLLPPI
jgi:hypothetical protein